MNISRVTAQPTHFTERERGQRTTNGLVVMAAEARRNDSGDLEVYRPPEPLWSPSA